MIRFSASLAPRTKRRMVAVHLGARSSERPEPLASQVCVVILSFNSARSLRAVVESCRPLAARVVVVDSFSTDNTVALARSLGCEVLEHTFDNYARQRNWVQDTLGITDGWFLHLDSDEVLTPELRASIQAVIEDPEPAYEGYVMRRVPYFMGKRIRHGAIKVTWHLRLFRAGKGRCEDRLYDQHYLVDGPTGHLAGDLLDLQVTSVEQWTASHNRWSTAEASEVWHQHLSPDAPQTDTLKASLFGDRRMQKRWLKNKVWYRMPLLLRPFVYFFYSYVLKLGFLDGRVGLTYHVLHSFWFRFLVDAKLLEQKTADRQFEALFQSLDELTPPQSKASAPRV